ncbi:phage portal protein [Aquamicrobium sp.]|uniref:phage portal protein n=1 Tax=Aquamicrobium sp. TaxID=1872579 RepID=UPI00258C4F17|nr:phage portal protein [Aquamicrobium sp.]MCK9550888.1 phage portal protein [Aquamicrobium sp.]
MGVLDRLSFWKRTTAPTATRRFDGAAGGRRGGGMGTFGRINPEIAAAGPSLASRAEYLTQNNPWISQAVANWVGALIGPGIMPNARHPNADARKALNLYFQSWWDDADIEGRTDFAGLQATVARSMVVKGESVSLLIATEEGPRLRVLDPALIDSSRTDHNLTFSGIELDENGKRLAYWILPEKPADIFASFAPSQRVDADSVLHVFKPVGAGQVRGASWLSPIILPASDFDQYCDALLMSAKVAAMHAGFIVNQNGTPGDELYSDSEPKLEPGALTRLGLGEDVKFNSPQQLQSADAFLKHGLRQLAAGLSLPEFLLSGDLSQANYSSLRAGLLPFRQRVEQIQYGVLVPQFLAPVWRAVILHGVLSGELDAPDFGSNPDAYLKADWLMPRPLQVDPLKDTQATVAEIEAGLTSRRKAVAERGWVLEDLDAEISADGFSRTGTKPPDNSENKTESNDEH